MLRNYLLIAFRSILKNKLTSFINIAGLAIAMASSILIFLFVSDELVYDKYNSKSDRTYRITREFFSDDGSVNLRFGNVVAPMGPLLKNDFGEIETVARTRVFPFVITREENGELKKVIAERNTFFAEPDIFRIFDFTILSGSDSVPLEKPNTVMLSEKTAVKFFGDADVVGKHLRAGNRFDLTITGVYKNLPTQSHWHPDLMISFSTLNDSAFYGRKKLETQWGNNQFGTYIVLERGGDPRKLESQLPAFLDRHARVYVDNKWVVPENKDASKLSALRVQKVTDIHLRSAMDDELEAGGNITNVYMISIIGAFIILIACFNFVNLSTATSSGRAKEVGLRKVVGAYKRQLIYQYLGESMLTALLGLVFALAFSALSLPWLNSFTQKNLSFNLIAQWPLLFILLAFSLLIGIFAGIYPAFVLSDFKPAVVLKGQRGSFKSRATLRKALVVIQFTISIVLIIATVIIKEQLGYLNTLPLGYKRDQVITLPFFRELRPNYDAFYNELTKNSSIGNASLSSLVPTNRLVDSYGNAKVIEGNNLVDPKVNFRSVAVDADFFDTYGIQIAAGRNFSKSIPTDDSLAFIINEMGAGALGWKNYNDKINSDFQYAGVNGKLIGIVKDFHFESLHQPISPMIFVIKKENFDFFSVRISASDMQSSLDYLGKLWKEYLPKRPFDYEFVSENYQHLYQAETKENQLFTIFSSMAVFIACMGLFGLATFNTMQRFKEIGIRKVLGASVGSILKLLTSEILLLVVVASVIACPLGWYFMNRWLVLFAYHIEVSLLVYVSASLFAVLIALLTISIQIVRAAVTNPTNILKYE
jgi:putative ABC transport system permease protein